MEKKTYLLKSLSLITLFFVAPAFLPPAFAEGASPLGEPISSQPVISLQEYEKQKAGEPVHVIGGDLTPAEKETVKESLNQLDDLMAVFENSNEDVREVILSTGTSLSEETVKQHTDDLEKIRHIGSLDHSGESKIGSAADTPRTNKTVVLENAFKNLTMIKKADPIFLINIVLPAGGNFGKLLLNPDQVSLSLVHAGAKNLTNLVRDNYKTIRDQVQKESFDRELLHKIQLVRQISAGIQDAKQSETPEKQWEVIDSVVIGRELAAVHYLMNPPQGLHPFLRLLFYSRLVTPQVMYWYVENIEKINAIYKQAKDGNGKIRYKGRIVDAFLPLPNEMGGLYELIVHGDKGSRKLEPSSAEQE